MYDLTNLEFFLHMNGWKTVEKSGRDFKIVQAPKDGESRTFNLILPLNKKLLDFERRLYDVFSVLAQVYSVQISDLTLRINHLYSDMIRNFLPIEGFPTINQAIGYLEVMKQMVLYSACSEKEPRPRFDSTIGAANEQGERCKFGHTFKGSFGIMIESPFAEIPHPILPGCERLEIPMERRIIERIYRGISSIEKAVTSCDYTVITKNYGSGLNSNMCRALLNIIGKSQKPVKIDIDWSPSIMPSKDIEKKPLFLSKEAEKYVAKAYEELEKVEPERKTVIGKVVSLDSKEPLNSKSKREICLSFRNEDNNFTNLWLQLSIEDYFLACDAHKSGFKVQIEGIVEKTGSRWVLVEPKDLKVL